MPKFNEDENLKLDKQIRLGLHDMTKKIKECEDNIKQISFENTESVQEKRSTIIYSNK